MVHGILMELTHVDLHRLYSEASVRAYKPEPVIASTAGGARLAALCYNLPEPPREEDFNAEYAAGLRELARRLGLPERYVETIGGPA